MKPYFLNDDISLAPLKKDIGRSTQESLREDLLAGISVALLTLPQSMAAALLAGLPLSCGLFAAIFSALLAAIFGCSRHLVIGPSNAIAIMVQAGTAEILFTYYRHLTGLERELIALQILTQLSLLVGLLQLAAASFKLGGLTRFVSHAVVVGYIVGVSFAVIVNQLYVFLGIPSGEVPSSLFGGALYLFSHLGGIHLPTFAIGLFSLFLIVWMKRIDKRIPAAGITFAIAACLTYFFNLIFGPVQGAQILTVADTGDFFGIFPKLSFPSFNLGVMNSLLPISFAIALLSILETVSVAKSIASSSGQRLSLNQEIFGVSIGNLASSLLGALPVSGSPSRSGLNYANGAKTRFAAVFGALSVGVLLVAFGPLVARIPLAALGALLLVTAMNIIDTKQLALCLKATGADTLVFLATLFSCLFFGLDTAFYIGVMISITLYLKKAATPQMLEVGVDESGRLRNRIYAKTGERKSIRVIKVEGELFFGAADLFQSTLRTIAKDSKQTKVIILQLKNARDLDATSCLALQHLHDYLIQSGRHLVLCGLTHSLWDVLSDAGMIYLLGKKNIFLFDEQSPSRHMRKAILRAKELVEMSDLGEEESMEVSQLTEKFLQASPLEGSY